MYALRQWRHYLLGTRARVKTDHRSLKYIKTQPSLSPRQARWLETLEEFDLEWEYTKGVENAVADALSRVRLETPPRLNAITRRNKVHSSVYLGPPIQQRIVEGYAGDAQVTQILEDIAAGKPTTFVQNDGKLYRKVATEPQLYVPDVPDIKQTLIREYHDSTIAGHLGRDKTLERLSRLFYWPGMPDDVAEYVRTCPKCQLTKPSNQAPIGLLQPLKTPQHRWEQVTMDFVTGLPRTERGWEAIVVFVDRLTKMIHVVPTTKDVTARATARIFFETVFRHHGMPTAIVSDRDPRFTSAFWSSLHQLLDTELMLSTAYHPQTDGQTERANRTVEDMLRAFCDERQSNWDELITAVEFAYNSSIQASTGFSPFYLNTGREPVVPAALLASHTMESDNPAADSFVEDLRQALADAKRNLGAAQERQARASDRQRRAHEFSVGDKVLLSTEDLHLPGLGSRKLAVRYCGPFTVTGLVGPNAVTLDVAPNTIHPTVNVSRVKPYRDDNGRFPGRKDWFLPPPVVQIDGQDAWTVEAFMARRKRGKTVQYLVRWAGYPPDADSWLPAAQLKQDLKSEFKNFVDAYERSTQV